MSDDDRFEMRQSPARRQGEAPTAKPGRVRKDPQIAVNGLAEYLTATAGGRKRILAEQKRPNGILPPYYREASSAIARCLAGGGTVEQPLDECLRRLNAAIARNSWDATRIQKNVEAAGAFRRWLTRGVPYLGGVRLGPTSPERMRFGGVAVSVRPELLFMGPGSVPVGAIKLYFSKWSRLLDDRVQYVGTILHQYIERDLGADSAADPKRCLVLDVFGGTITSAPSRYARRRKDVSDACSEIEIMWPTL
jgi:hypothetical protein